jgi:DNA recombination-dependent growth factor C
LEEFRQNIARYAFRNIDETSDQERSLGWVNIMDLLDSRFAGMEYLKEPCIAMSWRVDSRKVPAKALLRYCKEAEEEIKATEELEYLPRPRRREIKEAVRANLLKRAIPSSHTYDMIWNLQTGLLIFGNTSNKLCDEFSEFFLKCFGLHLKPVFPYSIAEQVLEKEDIEPDLLAGIKASAARKAM